MLRGLLKLVLLVVVLVAVGAFLLGWWGGRSDIDEPRDVVGTTGVDTAPARQAGERAKDAGADVAQSAKQVGSEVAQKTSAAAGQARRTLAEGSLTAKIKSKMALDDTVKALNLDVDTNGSVVTISGTVASENERTRALQLARETEGVTQVVDRIQVKR